ncbi:MAG: DUF397 domain-containing protein [Pseudonocardia sp.]|nr:DUF397 domain-containing protein [Pseudonocardia sp.]
MNDADLTGAHWRKSTRSNNQGNCVEVAFLGDGGAAVRDSKDQGSGSVLRYTASEWTAFLGGVKNGEFDRP